ncbi:hypothetical protein MTR67_052212 [Solanum verrucosum]|uniref:Uncharacterized protein n=1 Tax=Solanum verrucosum TaxID=315347 RepID=A0AAF0V6I2_SOLVR|nr:hypothetical protein MTR67_052212 [Solanum verrucosum]
MIQCFVRGLRTQLRVETHSLVTTGHSFLDIVDHARSIEKFHREAQGGSDKRSWHEGSYSRPYYRSKDYQAKPQQQFQQVQRARDAALATLGQTGSSHSAGQSTRASDMCTTGCSGLYFAGRSVSSSSSSSPTWGWDLGDDRRGAHESSQGGFLGGRSGGRGDARGGGRQDHFYGAPARVETEASDDVIAGMVSLCQQSASALFDRVTLIPM